MPAVLKGRKFLSWLSSTLFCRMLRSCRRLASSSATSSVLVATGRGPYMDAGSCLLNNIAIEERIGKQSCGAYCNAFYMQATRLQQFLQSCYNALMRRRTPPHGCQFS